MFLPWSRGRVGSSRSRKADSLLASAVARGISVEGLEERRLFALTVAPVASGASGTTLGNQLILPGTGLNLTGATYVGEDGQGGTFSGLSLASGETTLSLPDGVLLTSGTANGALGPNDNRGNQLLADESTDLNSAGDSDLASVAGTTTNDANSLTLHFTTASNVKSILFDFIYGSDEFPEFVGSPFNDAFAAFLDGVQISFDANNDPITVNNNFFEFNNSGLTTQQDPNVAGKRFVAFDIEYDGLTPQIRTEAPLNASITNHTLKFVIGDASDGLLDSGVFLARLQGSTQVVTGPTTDLPTPGAFEFAQRNYPIAETGGSVTLEVQRTGGASGLATVDYAVTGGTATNGQDYNIASGTLSFADGETSKTIVVPILDDAIAEGNETIEFTLSNPTGDATIATQNVAIVQIQDDEAGVEFSQPIYTVGEGTEAAPTVATIVVQRVGRTDVPFTVDYSTSDGTATALDDYIAQSGTLSFAAGETSKTIGISILSDFINEPTETVNLNLSNSSAGVGIPAPTATLNIENFDRPLTVTGIRFSTVKTAIDGLLVGFNKALVESRAEDPVNYDLFQYKEKKFGGSPSRKRVAIKSVTLDTATNTVAIKTSKPLKENQFYEVDVNTTRDNGIRTADFQFLDGDTLGDPGDDFVGYVGRGTKLNYFDQDGDGVQLALARRGGPINGRMEVFRRTLRIVDQLRLVGAEPDTILFGKVTKDKTHGDGVATIESIVGTPVQVQFNPAQFNVRVNRTGRA